MATMNRAFNSDKGTNIGRSDRASFPAEEGSHKGPGCDGGVVGAAAPLSDGGKNKVCSAGTAGRCERLRFALFDARAPHAREMLRGERCPGMPLAVACRLVLALQRWGCKLRTMDYILVYAK